MKRLTAVSVLSAFLAACGGGDDNASTPANTGPAIKLTYTGAPLVPTTSKARAMAAADSSASAPVASDSQDTISRLQGAFKARGADIGVYPGIINGSKLHDIVMSVNNGEAPTSAEMAAANVNISTWTLVNFQYDDMTGYVDTPEKQAAAAQFYKDIRVFAAREYIKGNVVYFARPILSCLPDKVDAQGNVLQTSAVSLWAALGSGGDNVGHAIGGIRPTPDQMGGDCQTPNATAQESYVDSVVDPLVTDYKNALDTINKCKHNPETIPENERAGQCWGITPDKK
ncbi:hypothetical protein WK90_22925 [Burkholderia cepacia]|uniref:hypothetical protein n=1 Tax=Burkholderia cepacia TaxID=292 RepID=UPI000752986F|nr:hypothetical protein WK83_26310 [Burkholderia cepacia]KVV62676.1 hypothetical protein WK85_05430 [Burkholderia cepacia]KVV68349.1 hypothetical protein WK84_20840 [Burkholderia cepacia]KVV75867.1 hypothetical protein WK86_29105 [Burkholderia cepacia]KVV79363.1 hypothetical protein WK87_29040 [Burkholderia cepacia]